MPVVAVQEQFYNELGKRLFRRSAVTRDTLVFRVQYQFGIFMLLLFSTMYAATYLKNKTMVCVGSKGYNDEAIRNVITDYCFVSGTFTLEGIDKESELFVGVGQQTKSTKVRYHPSYKWSAFYVFISASLLLAPPVLWRYIENGRLKRLCEKLARGILAAEADELYKEEKNKLVSYLINHNGYHRHYAYGYLACELMTLVVAGIQMYLWNVVAEYVFTEHSFFPRLSKSNVRDRTDPLGRAFPILGKCTFKNYGPGGTLQTLDFLCSMPLNLVNELAAVFFWYYFMLMGVLGALAVILRLCLVFSRNLRVYMLCGITSFSSVNDIGWLISYCSYSDWFMIYLLGNAMEPMVFRQVLQQFVQQLRAEDKRQQGSRGREARGGDEGIYRVDV